MDINQIAEGVANILRNNAVIIAVCLFILFMTVMGHRKGFMEKLLSFGSVIVTLLIEIRIYPTVLEYIKGNEAINSFFSELSKQILNGAFTGALEETNADEMSPLYELLGLDVLADNAADAIGDALLKVLCFIAIFIAVRLLVKLLLVLVKGLRKIHFIRWADELLGAVFGFAEGIIYVWIFMFIVSAFPGQRLCSEILTQISQNAVLKFIYSQNLIMQLFAEVLT